jgi:hypothetical protein
MSTNLPSFDRAEYALAPSSDKPIDQCARCQQPLPGAYYRINGDLACESCAAQATPQQLKDSHAAYSRAILYGVGAAIVGMILYALFEIVTGIIIGYIAIGVGYLVGKAMKLGSKGRGGRRYQIAAAILTYASVSVAAVPVGIHSYLKTKHEKAAQTASVSVTPDGAATQRPFPGDAPLQKPVPMSFGGALLMLLGLGLASPFLELTEGVGGFIGLFILFIGIRAAWSLTSGTDPNAPDVSGPFSNTSDVPAV